MHISSKVLCAALLGSFATTVRCASSWGFADGKVVVSGKGADGGFTDKLNARQPLAKTVTLGATDSLKIILTTQEDGKPKRPHQAFLSLKDTESGLETSFPLSIKESGKAKVDITQKDLPPQLANAAQPLDATLIIASFGASIGYNSQAFKLDINQDPSNPIPAPEKPLRYGKLDEIHHSFREDPKSPPKIISLVFTLAVLATLPTLLITWVALGANLKHLTTALNNAPLAHTLFFGSILALEGTFLLYYTSWNLFQTIPAAAAFGVVAFVSGSRALSEVQERRLAGLR